MASKSPPRVVAALLLAGLAVRAEPPRSSGAQTSAPCPARLSLRATLQCRAPDASSSAAAAGTLTRHSLRRVQQLRGGADGAKALSFLAGVRKQAYDALPNAVDTILAGFGLAGTLALMGVAQSRLRMPMYVTPMMASGIIFFAGPSPPHPKGFLIGTAGCASLSLGLLKLFTYMEAPTIAAQGAAAGALLVWYKLTNVIFPPAAVLANLLITSTPSPDSLGIPFVLSPWLSGHACLYAGALVMAKLRGVARFGFAHSRLDVLGSSLTNAELLSVFRKYDTSGDGTIDKIELKLALRMAVGADLSTNECLKLIQSVDVDGNEVIDFNEFKSIIHCKGR